MLWKLEPLTGWRKGVAILWGGALGAGLGIWAETCRYATGAADIDELYVQDYIPWDAFINPVYLGYGVIMACWGRRSSSKCREAPGRGPLRR